MYSMTKRQSPFFGRELVGGSSSQLPRRLADEPLGFNANDPNLRRYVGNDPTNATDPSGLLEVDDDPKNAGIIKLKDVNSVFDRIVTNAVRKAKKAFPDDKTKGIAALYKDLATDFLLQTSFEWGLKGELGADAEIIYQIPVKDSRYGKVPIDKKEKDLKKVPLMWRDAKFAEASLTSVVKISGVPIGLDKWGHFFQQGYWYFTASLAEKRSDKAFRDQFGLYMEGGPDAENAEKLPAEARKLMKKHIDALRKPLPGDPFPDNPPGFFGWSASGVVSYADMVANEAGYWFYKDLYDSWGTIDPAKYTFNVDKFFTSHKIKLSQLNEYLRVCSINAMRPVCVDVP